MLLIFLLLLIFFIDIIFLLLLFFLKQNEDGSLQPVTVIPKLEFQLEYGARIPTKSELVKQWTSIFFRPYSCLYRFLMHSCNSEIVMVERCDLNKVSNEAITHYNHNPHLGIGVLYKVFSSLIRLSPGNYLLRHQMDHGPFAALLEETDVK